MQINKTVELLELSKKLIKNDLEVTLVIDPAAVENTLPSHQKHRQAMYPFPGNLFSQPEIMKTLLAYNSKQYLFFLYCATVNNHNNYK